MGASLGNVLVTGASLISGIDSPLGEGGTGVVGAACNRRGSDWAVGGYHAALRACCRTP